MLSFAILPLLGLLALGGSGQAPSSQTPDRQNLSAWAEFIRPNRDELKFEAIGWRNRFWPAFQEAKELGRPILLWTMNGHPLGCT